MSTETSPLSIESSPYIKNLSVFIGSSLRDAITFLIHSCNEDNIDLKTITDDQITSIISKWSGETLGPSYVTKSLVKSNLPSLAQTTTTTTTSTKKSEVAPNSRTCQFKIERGDRAGKPCGQKATKDSDYCSIHKKKMEQKSAKKSDEKETKSEEPKDKSTEKSTEKDESKSAEKLTVNTVDKSNEKSVEKPVEKEVKTVKKPEVKRVAPQVTLNRVNDATKIRKAEWLQEGVYAISSDGEIFVINGEKDVDVSKLIVNDYDGIYYPILKEVNGELTVLSYDETKKTHTKLTEDIFNSNNIADDIEKYIPDIKELYDDYKKTHPGLAISTPMKK